MHLITGRRSEPHVTSANDGFKNSQIFGAGNYVLHSGGEFVATKVDDNTVRIATGQGLMNGRMFEITEAETVTIANGTEGFKRIDLIAVRYSANENTGIESVELVVIPGTKSTTPVAPSYNEGNILNGDTLVDYPIYSVLVENLTLSTITPIFEYKQAPDENLEYTKKIVNEGSHNLMPYPYYEGTKTVNGITFTVNSADGTVVANGTASATAIITLTSFHFVGGKIYRISGCPDGGSENGYRMDISGVSIDTGDGNTFTRQADNTLGVRIRIGAGTTVNNLVFKPMLVEIAEDGSYPTEYMRGSIYSNAKLTEEMLPSNYESSELTFSNCTFVGGGYCKIGKLVVINLRVNATSTSIIVRGFPSYKIIGNTNNIVHVCGYATSGSTHFNGYLNYDGELNGVTENGKSYLISAIYVCD